jgi:anti-anti-sigma factor
VEKLTPPEGPAASAQLSHDGDCPVVWLRGELDLSSVEDVRPVIDQVAEDQPARVVIDVGGLAFMDSSGLALLLTLAGRVGRVELRNPTAIVRRVIELTGLGGTLVIDP